MCSPKGTARPHLRSEQRLNYLVHPHKQRKGFMSINRMERKEDL